jgi:predicted DNA-binding protein (MmcQ/YjbR family)
MNIEILRTYCMSKPGTEETFPFGEDTLVFKVMGKAYLLTSLSSVLRINVKCDPERAIELREPYPEIIPGYHMNKKHWNTIDCAGNLSDMEILHHIDHSYSLVVQKLPKKLLEQIQYKL